ncbi:MAG: CHAT domain-containing protein [Bacteroidota bacterium]
MTDYADLELALRRGDGAGYIVTMRFSQAGSETDIRVGQENAMSAAFDLPALQAAAADPAAYGRLLSEDLFRDQAVLASFQKARAVAQASEAPLRVRLLLDSTAQELNTIFWEMLRDPADTRLTLFTGEDVVFSRYLSSMDWRPVKLRPRGELRALVAIANPSNLNEYNLAAVQRDKELARARNGLRDMSVTLLPANGTEFCTLEAIVERLRDGYDVLYLVAHGAFVREEPWLFLEAEDGKIARLSGQDLVGFIGDMEVKPRLIVLASCESAGKGAGRALQALGPRLADAGVPAIMAMQGTISIDTVSRFMPVFFAELQRDGRIDRAVSVARGTVRDESDFWMPVLFMRLKSGRIWYVPGFSEGRQFHKWKALIAYIKDQECTPVLGPGLFEPMLGSLGDFAQAMAREFHYPLSPADVDSLPRVTQYLTINQTPQFPYSEIQNFFRRYIRARYPEDLAAQPPDAGLDDLVDAIGVRRRARQPDDAYKLLAALPFRIYVTTNWSSLLESALREAGKEPQVILAPWNRYTEDRIKQLDLRYEPSSQQPLIYYLFGHLAEPRSVVLTEDNYFDYLLGVSRNNDLIPAYVRNALRNTSLLFIGFRIDEWNFRVLFRSIIDKKTELMNEYVHISAQIEPDEGRIIDPEGARGYLEQYFDKSANLNLYWGSADEFVKELWDQWKALG